MSDPVGTIEFDVAEGRYRTRYDPETIAPSVAVVEVARTVCDRERAASEPLYEAIDPEALDRFLEPSLSRDRHGSRSVTFSFLDARVTVTSDGRIRVDPHPGSEIDR